MSLPVSRFHAAQARVLERQRAREAEARSRDVEWHEVKRLPRAMRALPGPLQEASRLGWRAWGVIAAGGVARPEFRVGQQDAELLDEELVGFLKGQVDDAFKYFDSHTYDRYAEEIMLVLRTVLFKLSIWDHNSSYGASLQNLKYADARSDMPVPSPPTRLQKALYGVSTLGGRYVWNKWEAWLMSQDSDDEEQPRHARRLASTITSIAANMYSVAAFLNFLLFLLNGRHRTLPDRLLRMRLVVPSPQVTREISLEYLNRQLVWHSFTEFLLFLLPLLGINRWRRWLARTWKKAMDALSHETDSDSDSNTDARGNQQQQQQQQRGVLAFLPEKTCPICYADQHPQAVGESETSLAATATATAAATANVFEAGQTDIVNPYQAMPCGCIYCYTCIADALEACEGDGYVCLRCGGLVGQCKPWDGDVRSMYVE